MLNQKELYEAIQLLRSEAKSEMRQDTHEQDLERIETLLATARKLSETEMTKSDVSLISTFLRIDGLSLWGEYSMGTQVNADILLYDLLNVLHKGGYKLIFAKEIE